MEPRITIEETGSVGWKKMVELRDHVLRAPLGLAFSDEQLAAEVDQIHLALWLEDVLVGTLLLMRPDPDRQARLRQMAIQPALERRGLGRFLVHRGEAELGRLGATSVRLAARESAVGFYVRLGYAIEGVPFIEVTLPHRTMTKLLYRE